jgi:hypothetical protein
MRLLDASPRPDADLIRELEQLLDEARSGKLRALMFAGSRVHGEPLRFGSVGDYDLRDLALGLRLLELELESLITSGSTPADG